MTRALTIIFVTLVLALAVPLAAGTQSDQQTNAERQARTACGITMNNYLRQGQPVVLTLTLENRSFEEVVFDLGYAREGAFQFKLKHDEGNWIDLPQKQVRDGISLVPKVSIPSQESYSQQIILDEWYKFNELGKYTVSVTLPNSLCRKSELDFEILPFDKEAVDFLISFLEKNVSSSSSYELVRPALVRLEKRSAPQEVEKIRIALARFPVP